jgi:putative ATP-dependent endonuclease of the OLD family
LLAVGRTSTEIFGGELAPADIHARLSELGARNPADTATLQQSIQGLRRFDVFFSVPLDLDYSMLRAFFAAYQRLEPGMRGPRPGDARPAVLGDEGLPALYGANHDAALSWYRYLFLGRSKPSTHVRVLAPLDIVTLKAGIPESLKALLDHVIAALGVDSRGGAA